MQTNVELTYQMRNHLLRGRLRQFGRALHDAWQFKRQLGAKITTPALDRLYEGARENGAVGGKLLGAGGGGFFLFFAPPFRVLELTDYLTSAGLRVRPFRFEAEGLQSWSTRERKSEQDDNT